MTAEEFIEWLGEAARRTCGSYGLFASVCVAQAALESGWGQYIIGKYNLFGRKWGGSGAYIEQTTQEYEEGEWITIVDKFQDYDSLDAALADWCVLITEEPVYAPCLQYLNDREGFVAVLGPIYATDPDYAEKIMSIISSYSLAVLDV